jgi:hypothetical protein
MYIEKVPNRNSPPAVLRPYSYREGDQVKKRTLANLSKLPDDIIDNLRLFGLCYAMNGGYKRWNPYREKHLAIFVNYF